MRLPVILVPALLFLARCAPLGGNAALLAQEPPPAYWLGVIVEPNAEDGMVRVFELAPDSPAAKSMLQRGDILRSANGKKLASPMDLANVIREADGKPIEFVVLRGGEEKKIAITPEKRPDEKIAEPELAKELLERVRGDQAVRQEFMQFLADHGEKGVIIPENLSEEVRAKFEDLTKRFRETDKRNREFLKQVLVKHGWPGKSLVGIAAAQAAFLFAQHSDEDTEFQKQCLEKMKAMPEGEVSKQHLAMLTDRVLVHEGKKQLYGTQLTMVDGKFQPSPIEDEENVDARRKEMGLPSLADYIRMVEAMQPAPQKK